MRTYQDLRRFTVQVRDERTGESRRDAIVLSKDQLQAAQIVGLTREELLARIAARNSCELLNVIGKPDKLTTPLDELWRRSAEAQEEKAKWAYLYGGGAD